MITDVPQPHTLISYGARDLKYSLIRTGGSGEGEGEGDKENKKLLKQKKACRCTELRSMGWFVSPWSSIPEIHSSVKHRLNLFRLVDHEGGMSLSRKKNVN